MTAKEWGDRLGRYDIRESAYEDFWTICPCHDDTRPSMHVYRLMDGRIQMRCFACGSGGEDVCRELGLPERELLGEPMGRRRRRRPESQRTETEPREGGLLCLACGAPMTVDVWPDILAGGWIAQGRCSRERGCGMWQTQAVRGANRTAAAQALCDAARRSWRMLEDKSCMQEGKMYGRY